MENLAAEGYLTFVHNDETDRLSGEWQWDNEAVNNIDITDNVVDLMVETLNRLPEDTRDILQLAACMGGVFDLQQIADLYRRSVTDIYQALLPSIDAGLVFATSTIQTDESMQELTLKTVQTSSHSHLIAFHYRFSHERVRQAFYILLPQAQRCDTHLRIGRLWLANATVETPDNLLDIVNQLNLGMANVEQPNERRNFARLNLTAGQKARETRAYMSAMAYFQEGLAWLGEARWQTHYELTLQLTTEVAEAAYLAGEFNAMPRYLDEILKSAKTLLDQAPAYEIQMLAEQAQNRFQSAVETGLKALRLMKMDFPRRPGRVHILWELFKTRRLLAGKTDEQLLNLPPMSGTREQACMRILSKLSTFVYLSEPGLSPLIILARLQLCVKYGYAPGASVAYAGYGLLLASRLNDVDGGLRYGEIALKLLGKTHDNAAKARVMVIFNAFIAPWKIPLENTLPTLREAYQVGLDTGDQEYAAIATSTYMTHAFYGGYALDKLNKEMAVYDRAITGLNQAPAINRHHGYWQVVQNMLGKAAQPWEISGAVYDFNSMLPGHEQAGDSATVSTMQIFGMMLCYLFGQYQQAMTYAKQAMGRLDSLPGVQTHTIFHLYYALTCLALHPRAEDGERARLVKSANQSLEVLRRHAAYLAANAEHKVRFVEAELLRISGDEMRAAEAYDKAIELAEQHGYNNEAALAGERAANFWQFKGKNAFASIYLRRAYYNYSLWGGYC